MALSSPKISIVVPNYRGGATLEATLRSLIDQQYPSLEILVVDGGSTDQSVEIIRKFEPHIAWWVSEKDRGQSHAINKGFARATGDIVNWLCSDDQLAPGALEAVARYFSNADAPDVIAGRCRFIYHRPVPSERIFAPDPKRFELMPCVNAILQPSCFYRRRLLDRTPPLDETLHYVMDFELWNYFISKQAKWMFIDEVLSDFHTTGVNKSSIGGGRIAREMEIVYKRYTNERIPLTFWHRHFRYPLERIRRRHPGWAFAIPYYAWQCSIIGILSLFYGYRRTRWMNWVEWG